MFSQNSCRICQKTEENLTSTTLKKENEVSLNELLAYCVPEIDWNCKKLSSLICLKCTEDLHIAFNFRKQCLESDKLRQNYIVKKLSELGNQSESNGFQDKESNYFEQLYEQKKAVQSFRINKIKTNSMYSCIECPKKFNSNISYKIHVGKLHKAKKKEKDNCLSSLTRSRTRSPQKVTRSGEGIVDTPNDSINSFKLETNEDKFVMNNDKDFIQCNVDIDIKIEPNSTESANEKQTEQNTYFNDGDVNDNNEYENGTSNENTEVHPQIPASTATINEKYFPGKKDKKCKICFKEFTKTTTLMNHFRSIHSLENCFKCRFCDQAFPNQERLARHENHHTGDRKYVCSICGKKFFTNSDLFHHNERHNGDRKYKCDICNVKSFTTQSTLRTHKKIVHSNPEDWKYLCTQCGRKCVTQWKLNAHMKRHGDRKDFPCNLCEKGFCTKAELENHLRAHSDQREFKCELCEQQFKLKKILERHLYRKHGIGNKKFPEGTKKHLCPICPLRYCSKLQLEKHLRSHNGERPFKCDYCEHSFICSSHLKGHIKNKHPTRMFKEQTDSNSGSEVVNDM